MPLFPVSPNIQELESTSRKTIHDEYIDGPIKLAIDHSSNLENLGGEKHVAMATSAINSQPQVPPVPTITMDSTPGSSPGLTEPGSSPPIEGTPSPNRTPSKVQPEPTTAISHPSQLNPTTPASTLAAQGRQPTKRKTAAEKEQERAEKRQKKDAETAEKAQKKAEEEAAKLAKAAEREAEKAEKAKKKAADEAARAAKAAEKEAKKRKKEEEELATKRKKEKQRSMLASFVQRAPGTPSKKPIAQATTTESSPKPNTTPIEPQMDPKPQKSAYERRFQPFFVKSGVTLAPRPFEMDEQTRDAKSDILDEYIRGERGEFNPIPFNPRETFHLAFPQQRGRIPLSVKKIMESIYGDPVENALGLTAARSESQTEKLTLNAQDQLNSIPMKRLSFYEDVRPPYFGTITTPMTTKKLHTLSRRPVGKLLQLSYDYDSEAEWVEDDGEDLDDEEDDEEDEGDEEMDDFLDDSEDLPTTIRPTFLGEKEPCSTGICFEDKTRLGPCPTVYKYRMEFMLDTLEHHSGIDPFSTSYWPSPLKKVPAKNTAIPAAASSSSMPPPPPGISTDAFSTLVTGTTTVAGIDVKELVPKDVFDDFRRAIISEEFRDYTKGTIVDLLAKKFSTCTKAQLKTTLDKIAHRTNVPGEKKSVKHWALLPAFAF